MDRLKLLGAPGSPYTRKMLAVLRYRQIPYEMIWGGHQNPPPGLPQPKVKLLPTFYFPADGGGVEAMIDSTPIIRRLEQDYSGRSVLPSDPALAFLDALIEDYADEWLTKAMFHYRWARKVDCDNAGPLLVYWSMPTIPADQAKAAADAFTKRQVDRLYVVGSNETTAETIEDSYKRFVGILDGLISQEGYVMGSRPGAADFAIYGQLTQLGIIEPTSAAVTNGISQRVRAWIDRMEDLSGLDPEDSDWLDPGEAGTRLKPLLAEIGRVYAPFLIANAKAAMEGADEVSGEIDGRPWVQPTFPYQAKCFETLRDAHSALPADARKTVDAALSGTGCDAIFGASGT
ncbi:glutathione S-transferase [Henriciella sp.]|uniref:glutathione S-transferase n=1 Tax=Henriciella sp. TaxID=1968823 RepID=UPI00261E5CFB|nr:glutathione S-transferase [Henriciella sp.]